MGNRSAIMNRLDKIEKNTGLDKRLALLASQGYLRLPTSKEPSTSFTPVHLEGEPFSEILIRDRL